MKRAQKLIQIARDSYENKRKRKRISIPSPVPPGSENEVSYLMGCIGDQLNEVDENIPTVETTSSRENYEITNVSSTKYQVSSTEGTLVVLAEVHDTPSRFNVISKQPTLTTNSPVSLTNHFLQPSLQVPEQSDISLNTMDSYQQKTPVTDEIHIVSSIQEGQKTFEVESNATLYNIVENCELSVTLDSSAVENMSIASADIVIDSPYSSISIPSVPSIVQSDASSGGSPCSSRRNDQRKKKTCKIRTRNVTEWKDLKRKALKNAGKQYINRSGSLIGERILKPPCNCTKKCAEKISQEDRELIFKRFWDIADHERQWEFISKCVTQTKPKRIKAAGPNRSRTNTYKLQINSLEAPVIVCQVMFLNTLSISEKMVRTVVRKQLNDISQDNADTDPDTQNSFKMTDLRGRHHNRPHKLPDSVHESVKDHINSLIPIESHYCRKSSTKKYLDGHLSYARLHQEYIKWFDTEKYCNRKATFRQYTDIVNANFNIAFHSPKKDQCDRCHIYSSLQAPTEEQKQEYDVHIALKNKARDLKDLDKAAAQNDRSIITACFDMQKVLNCPHGEVSVFFYKRRLNLYDFTVFDMANKLGFCYMWDEITGKKGANEIGSGLLMFIQNMLGQGAKNFRFWSDNCSGQNRNRIIFALYQHIIKHYVLESITHKFLEVGHTQNEGDSVHSVIERASNKGRVIYTPEQWFNVIRWAKTGENGYRVMNMTQDDILNLRSLLDTRNWLKNDEGDKVMWNKVKEIHVKKEKPETIYYKYDLRCEEYKAITTLKKTRSKKKIVGSMIENAYKAPLKLNYDKYKDLVGMCESKIIPQEFESFFKNLPHHDRNGINIEQSDDDE